MAYKASYFLNEENFWVSKAFAVGSPRFLLSDVPFNSRFIAIIGQNWDPITSIGKWNLGPWTGSPSEILTVNLNPANKRFDFHAAYFKNSRWIDSNGVEHFNDVDLISLIKSKSP